MQTHGRLPCNKARKSRTKALFAGVQTTHVYNSVPVDPGALLLLNTRGKKRHQFLFAFLRRGPYTKTIGLGKPMRPDYCQRLIGVGSNPNSGE